MHVEPTVLLVEDDGATRARLGAVIAAHPGLQLAGSAACYAEGLERLLGSPPTVLLTDLGLPDGSGIDLIRAIQEHGLPTEAMVITVFGDERHVFSALQAGATGYLLKDADAADVTQAILQLLAGGSPISPAIARQVLRRLAPAEAQVHPQPQKGVLTEREREVLTLLAKGFAYAEAADLLGMSAGTVTTHVKHIYRKLAVRSRGEAVFEAVQRGLLNIGER